MNRTHRISVGNLGGRITKIGMSTTVAFGNGLLCVGWKYDQHQEFPAQAGDEFQIITGEGFPEVRKMIAPRDTVSKVGWEFGFYKAMRIMSKEELVHLAQAETRYSQPHGYEIPSAMVSKGENCAVAYRAVMEGQRGVPWRWWANEKCSSEELRIVIRKALGCDCHAVYGQNGQMAKI